METKFCRSCKTTKPTSEFYFFRKQSNTPSQYCKACYREKGMLARHTKTTRRREQVQVWSSNKRAAKFNLGKITLEEWQLKKKEYNYKCYACYTSGSDNNILTLDHIKPLSKGGKNSMDNIQVLCLICNQKKKDSLDIQPYPGILGQIYHNLFAKNKKIKFL